MKGWYVFLIIFVLLASISYASEHKKFYDIIVSSSGESAVVLEIEGSGVVPVSLPFDVKYPSIRGAIYIKTENGVDVFLEENTKAYLLYKTSMYAKKDKTWRFYIANITADSVKIHLPKTANLLDMNPQTFVSKDKITLISYYNTSGEVTIDYEITEETNKNNTNILLMILVIVIVFLIAYILIFFVRKKPKIKEFGTVGQYNVARTLSNNEKIIVKMLLERNGGMKRNELEKESKISKSSLANSLNNLEQKEIVRIDKTYPVHYVELTEWFKGL